MSNNEVQSVLSISGLNKDFFIRKQILPALRSLNLEIGRGEFICIVGGSGCGKSTLLRIIAGLENGYSGSVLIDGRSIQGPGTDRGFVFQEHRLFPWLTVEENIAFGLSERNAEANRSVMEHIKLVGLKGFERSYPHQLSGGMAQRAAIARAIVNRPEILLMDEPFGALDAFTKIQMHEEIQRIRIAEETTVILVTHDIDEAVYLGDRVVVMSNRPGTIRNIYSIDLTRPRDRHSVGFIDYRKRIFNEFFAQAKTLLEYTI